jgi:hypothetical protein
MFEHFREELRDAAKGDPITWPILRPGRVSALP